MTAQEIKNNLSKLFYNHFGTKPNILSKLPGSGSDRIYFRIKSSKHKALGAFNADLKENGAFFSFTETLKGLGINVPEIFSISEDRKYYLISDLGNDTLFDLISKNSQTGSEDPALYLIKASLSELINIQLKGGKAIDFSKCYPREAFDRQSIMWDLNYFKYEFLKLAGIPFDEQALENDFNALTDFLLKAPAEYFMYRDFQSLNIMIVDGVPWFIDYQGGRKGPLQYDLASILYSPKTGLNTVQREVFLDFYISKLKEKIEVDRNDFTNQYYGFALIRILQALGAYGFRGLYEKKVHFRSSIPTAISNLKQLFGQQHITIDLPEIKKIVYHLALSGWAKEFELFDNKLTVRVTSFSYNKGIPDDPTENGGGFVFDCRGLPNPGRLDEYKAYSGLDKNVEVYLEQFGEVKGFQENVRKVVETSLNEYLNRGFNHLCVNFGCTGGQHRSVYNAEKFCNWLENNFPVKVVLVHREKENWISDEQSV